MSTSESDNGFDLSNPWVALAKALADFTQAAEEATRFLEEYKEKHQDEHVQLTTFSSGIDEGILEFMTRQQTLSIDWKSLIANIDADLERRGFKETLKKYWEEDLQRRSNELTRITWRRKPNGGNQGTFDCTMMHMRFAYDTLGLAPIWPHINHEVGIWESIRFAYKPVDSEKTLTYLIHGRLQVEDAYLTQFEHRGPRTALGEQGRRALWNGFDQLRVLQNPEYRPLLENEFSLLFAEYQSPIEEALGSSIIKAMAIMQMTGTTSITWSLGNGLAWIFGVIIDSDKKYVYRTKIFRIDNVQDYEAVYTILVYAGIVPPKKLLEVFQACLTAI